MRRDGKSWRIRGYISRRLAEEEILAPLTDVALARPMVYLGIRQQSEIVAWLCVKL